MESWTKSLRNVQHSEPFEIIEIGAVKVSGE